MLRNWRKISSAGFRFSLRTRKPIAREHAIEVELPFLQSLRPDFSFVPIALATRRFEILQALGEAIAEALRAHREAVLLIASSDMNHYESDRVTRSKDQKAIARILALDPRGLFDTVMKENISMCGMGPAVTLLAAANRLGGASAELIDYATSGDVSGDRETGGGICGNGRPLRRRVQHDGRPRKGRPRFPRFEFRALRWLTCESRRGLRPSRLRAPT